MLGIWLVVGLLVCSSHRDNFRKFILVLYNNFVIVSCAKMLKIHTYLRRVFDGLSGAGLLGAFRSRHPLFRAGPRCEPAGRRGGIGVFLTKQ